MDPAEGDRVDVDVRREQAARGARLARVRQRHVGRAAARARIETSPITPGPVSLKSSGTKSTKASTPLLVRLIRVRGRSAFDRPGVQAPSADRDGRAPELGPAARPAQRETLQVAPGLAGVDVDGVGVAGGRWTANVAPTASLRSVAFAAQTDGQLVDRSQEVGEVDAPEPARAVAQAVESLVVLEVVDRERPARDLELRARRELLAHAEHALREVDVGSRAFDELAGLDDGLAGNAGLSRRWS